MAAMSLPEGYRVVEVPHERKDEFLAIDGMAFAMEQSPETLAIVPDTLQWGRTMGVDAPDGALAAVHASYRFTLPVPGGAVPCSGLTWVGVRPDHRRRGLLSAMIGAHFERSAARGEPVSALFAAEAGIYGRFGYGQAAADVRLSLPRGASLRPVAGSERLTVRLATLDADVHADLVDDVHRAAGAGRPGWVTRDTPELRRNHVVDPPAWREGGERMRLATVHAPDGAPVAYALLRRKEKWEHGGPQYTVSLRAAAAASPAAAHRLWTFLLDLDLTVRVESPMLPLDDPLLALLVDPRGALPRLGDNLWVRLLDVPTALTARRYCAPVDAVLEVSDDLLPANAGRWRLTTAPSGDGGWAATVTRTDESPDLRLDVRELGAAYLGHPVLTAAARAGLAEEARPGAAHTVAAAFGWPVAPLCSWVF
jgi:predicted acetyltransferase